MSARAIAIHGNEKSGERRANLEIKSECPALYINSYEIICYKTGMIAYFHGASLISTIYIFHLFNPAFDGEVGSYWGGLLECETLSMTNVG